VIDKHEAEKLIAQLLQVFDDLGAYKERDEVLNFRRRLRLFAAVPVEPYRTHMRDTLERLPRYASWLEASEEPEAAGWAERLAELIKGMLEPVPVFTSCNDGA
jgi:hypothetical protein